MSSPTINWQTTVPLTLAMSADLCYLYPAHDPGSIHCRSCPVTLTPAGIAHLSMHDLTRMAWHQPRTHLIIRALTQPEIVYQALEWKSRIGLWSQFFAVRDTLGSTHYVAVAVTLARMTGDKAAQYHRVTTIFAAKESYLFTKTGTLLALKSKWIWA